MIYHFTAVRVRANGVGQLNMRLHSLDNAREQIVSPILITNNGRELQRLTNFLEERAQLEISLENINEYFIVKKITIFAKPVFSSFPG